MSIDNSDMIVDIHSLKDSKEIPDIESNDLIFEDTENEGLKTKKKRINKKVTPNEMLERMKETIEEEGGGDDNDEG